MRIIDLALKDLSQLVRDWKAATFLLIMPIAFTLLFGFVFSGEGAQEEPRLPVGFLDQDDGSVLSTHLLHLLTASAAIQPIVLESADPEGLMEQVVEGDLAAVVIVPAGYGQHALGPADGLALRPKVIVDLDSIAGHAAQTAIQATVARLMGSTQAARLSGLAYEAQGGSADSVFLEETLDQAVAAWQKPPLTVTTSHSQTAAESGGDNAAEPSGFAHSSAGIMVQFALAGLMGAGEILVLERKSGALRRLLTTPISRFEIILGHYLAMFVMIFLQLSILVVFGQIFLGVGYFRVPLATLLIVVTTALWFANLGLLVGIFARTQEQVIMIALVLMMVLAGLGGAWMSLEFTSETFQTVGHLTPTAWSIDGLENIVIRGLGLESVWLPAVILSAYAVVLFGLAVWRFKFE